MFSCIQQAMAWLLALLQFLGLTAGILPYDKEVDYGGIKFVEPVVTDWLTLILIRLLKVPT